MDSQVGLLELLLTLPLLAGLMDFPHLSLIQTKKQEMDSQVGLLELLLTLPLLAGLMDFPHLSLIQTKKQEMDSQVGLLELLLTLPLLAGLMVSHTNQETRDGLPGRSSWTVINPSLASRFDGLSYKPRNKRWTPR